MKRILKVFDYFFIGFSYLATKKIIVILIMILIVSSLNTSFGHVEEEEQVVGRDGIINDAVEYEKGNAEIKYYNDNITRYNYGSGFAIGDYVSCYQDGIDVVSVPDSVNQYINELKSLFDENEQHFSFFYQDLFSGFTVSYNEDSPIFTASSIKAPAMIYLYEKASVGEIDLNEKLVYDGSFYSDGSGVLKTKEINTSYTVDELIYYAVHYSDNIAYAMLMNRFSRENVLSFWVGLGTKYIFTRNTIWGITSAKDASIYMKELYRFYLDNEEYGGKLVEYFRGADWKLITDKNGEYNTASKGGWAGSAIHDATIVFDKNPYVFVVMSNTGESNYNYLFKNASILAGKLHEEYWKYKVESCELKEKY